MSVYDNADRITILESAILECRQLLTKALGESERQNSWNSTSELRAVHDEVHVVLAEAGATIHDLANKDHAAAIRELIEQRDRARRVSIRLLDEQE